MRKAIVLTLAFFAILVLSTGVAGAEEKTTVTHVDVVDQDGNWHAEGVCNTYSGTSPGGPASRCVPKSNIGVKEIPATGSELNKVLALIGLGLILLGSVLAIASRVASSRSHPASFLSIYKSEPV